MNNHHNNNNVKHISNPPLDGLLSQIYKGGAQWLTTLRNYQNPEIRCRRFEKK